MPKHAKGQKKSPKVIERTLGLSDRYLFNKTFLDTYLISKLEHFTDNLVKQSEIVKNKEVICVIDGLRRQLINHEFNNIYDYLDAIVDIFDNDPTSIERVYNLIEEIFPEPLCIKLVNMYTTTSNYDL